MPKDHHIPPINEYGELKREMSFPKLTFFCGYRKVIEAFLEEKEISNTSNNTSFRSSVKHE